MPAVLVQIDGYDPVAAAAVTLRAASVDDERVCHLDGQIWWPAIASLPTLRYDLFDGGFGGKISSPQSSLTLAAEIWPNLPRYMLADARLRLWTGNAGDSWGSYTLRFDGRIDAQPAMSAGVATVNFGVDDRWLDAPLLSLYAGTGGIEGEVAQKGQTKPLSIGAPRYAPGRLIDSVNNVIQLSAYGAIEGVETAMDRLGRFAAAATNAASYAALIAASVPAGAWATSLATGLVRQGAPPEGTLSYHVRGDKAGPDGWARLPGKVIRRIALLAGGTGKIDDTALDALDVARPWTLSLYQGEQVTARELIQRIAASVNAVAGVDWLGKLFVIPIGYGSSAATLDATGAALPPVASVAQLEIDAPYWKLAIGAQPTWEVHALSDVAFSALLVERGIYVSTENYREGHIVDVEDGSRFLYTAGDPSTGNAPPAATFPPAPPASNAYWQQIKPPLKAEDIAYDSSTSIKEAIDAAQAEAESKGKHFYQTTFPAAAGSSENDSFYDLDDRNRKYRRLPGDGVVSIGGSAVAIGGQTLGEYAWTPADNGAIANFDARNDRIATAVVAPTIPGGGAAIDHVLNTDGSADISFEWLWSGNEAEIDGMTVLMRSSSTSEAYTFGSAPAEEVAIPLPADRRAFFVYGVPANRYYSFAVQAFRVVDPDIAASGKLASAVVKASLAGENPYQPSANVAFSGDITGTVNGTSAAVVATATGNFNARNDRIATAVLAPTVPTDGSGVDHELNNDGSANLIFRFAWSGAEADIDGFEIGLFSSTSGSAYMPGTTPGSEDVFAINAAKRVAIIDGVAADRYFTIFVRAYRIVDPDVAAGGKLTSAWVKPSIAGENPYRPAASVAFNGNVTGAVNGKGVALITGAVDNFDARNDRIATAVVAPTIAVDGSAVDHTLNTDGSADLSFEWLWAGTEAQIDGFDVLFYSDTSASAYTIGSAAAAESISSVPASKRAATFPGVPANRYYTLAIRAFRIVDPDIDASGRLTSAWVKPSIAGENPYRPSASIAFGGDVTGTVGGVAAATVKDGAAKADAGLDSSGNVLTNKVGTASIVSGAVNKVVATYNGGASYVDVAQNAYAVIATATVTNVSSASKFLVQAGASLTNIDSGGGASGNHKECNVFLEYSVNGGTWTQDAAIGYAYARFYDVGNTVVLSHILNLAINGLYLPTLSDGMSMGFRIRGQCASGTNGSGWEHTMGYITVTELRR